MSLNPAQQFNEAGTSAADFDPQDKVLPNSPILSADVNTIAERAIRRTKYLRDTKADLAGATFTGPVVHNGTLEANSTAQFDGAVTTNSTFEANGTAQFDAATTVNAALVVTPSTAVDAITATGGAGESAFIATAGAGNQSAIVATGTGTGPGITAAGGTTGPGIIAGSGTNQTATAPTEAGRFAGYIQMSGADPNPTVDPGVDNAIHGANLIKAWVTFDDTYAILDGYNVASIALVLGTIYKVTFVRPMANANYGVKIHVHGAVGFSGALNSNKTANDFEFTLFKTTDLSLGFGTATNAFIEVTGRQ